MRARWGAAIAAASLAASAGARPGAATCELGRVDRAASLSMRCLTCHDGSAGPAVGFEAAAGGLVASHPVAIDYEAAAAAHPGQYRPIAALPPEVPLVGGRVECTTCHDARAPGPAHVAQVRDLCLACHQL